MPHNDNDETTGPDPNISVIPMVKLIIVFAINHSLTILIKLVTLGTNQIRPQDLLLMAKPINNRVFNEARTNDIGRRSGGWKTSFIRIWVVNCTRFQNSSVGIKCFAIWLSSSSYLSPTTSPLSSIFMSSFRLKRHSTSNQQRNSKTPSKTSDRVDTASSSAIRLPFKPFCDPQKRWRSTTSTQPQTFESTYADSTFQNGNYANHHQSPTTRRFFNIHRFARRIPPHTDSPSVSSSTAIPVENTNLSIPCFTFRPQPVSFSVHQSPQTSTEMGSSSRDSDYGISGRSFNHGQFLSTNPTFHSQGMQKNDQFGLVNKYVQVNTDTVAVYPSLRDEHRFQRDDSISSREENPSDPPNGLFTSQASQSQLDQLSPVHRLCTGHTARELSSTFPDSSSFNSVKPFSLPRSFYHQCTDAERATMVDHGNDEMEWTPSIIHPSHNSNIYGRIRPRVWNCLGSTFHPRYMVQTREDSPHQSERIVGDRQSIQIYSFSNQSPSTIMYGQHVSDSVYQTFWGNEILNPEQDCPRYMEILLSELHSAVNFIRPIKIKSSGRAVESPTTSNRMVTTSPNVHSPQSALGPASCRSVCLPDQTSSSSIRHLELPSPSSMDECIQPIVEPPTRTVILSPTVEPSLDDLEKIDTGTSSGDSHNAQLAVCPMVPSGTAVSPISTSPVGNSSQGRKRFRITPADEESAMDPTNLESSVKRLRLSESALATINAPSSKKSIPYIQTTFINWCSIRDINYQEHPINSECTTKIR
ncbi:hypothetical protein G6F17_012170 [Rhizopus arrhizus]|nr:hypothetical protein G6F17_012170 [Rhizopus arrhizus]